MAPSREPDRPDVPGDLPDDPSASYVPNKGDSRLPASETWLAPNYELHSEPGTAASTPFRRHTPPGGGLPAPMGPDATDESGEDFIPVPMTFVLQSKVAQGGFGEVWKAAQSSLGRTVAVKKLRADLLRKHPPDTPEGRAVEVAFRQEAIITAHLEHPNIVPVYDLGLDEQGLPLLAMKLVRGEPWNEVLRRDFMGMPVPEFLARHLAILISVANGAAFAHSRGIVHRDIKPGQVIIGEYGEVLLMDWGLSAMFDSEAARRAGIADTTLVPTLESAVNPCGTPAFMAPEQTERTCAHIGPWTDVYLLGGLLYSMLTGTAPHHAKSARASFVHARDHDVPPPAERARDRELPSDLVAIATRALRRDRRQRHSSALEFIAEIQDYLSGATRRRESAAVTQQVEDKLADALDYRDYAELTVLLGNARALWPDNPRIPRLRERVLLLHAQAALENDDLVLARAQTERLRDADARAALLEEITVREESRQRAHERLKESFHQNQIERDRAEDLLSFLLDELQQRLRPLHQLDLLDTIVKKALQYYESIPEDEDETAERARNRALAFRHIGDVLKNQGRIAEALAAYRRYQDIARRWHERDRADSAWRSHLATAYDLAASALYFRGSYDEATALNRMALAIREELLAQFPGDPSWVEQMAWNHHQLGVVAWRQGFQKIALAEHDAAIALRAPLVAARGADDRLVDDQAWTITSRSNVLRAMGRLDEALAAARQGLHMREELALRNPGNRDVDVQLGWSLTTTAAVMQDLGDFAGALALFRRSLGLHARLADADPTNASRRLELAFTYGALGRLHHERGQLEEACEAFRAADGIITPLAENDPSHLAVLLETGWILNSLCEALVARGLHDDARPVSARVYRFATEIHRQVPDNPTYADLMAKSHVMQGILLEHDGRHPDAHRAWRRAVDLLQPYAEGREFPAWQEVTLASALLLLDRVDEARPIVARILSKNFRRPQFLDLCRAKGLPT